MQLAVQKTLSLQGELTVPSSKSQSIRALVFALLARGSSKLSNLLAADDTQAALEACTGLGGVLTKRGNFLSVESPGLPLKPAIFTLNTRNSGITTRFILPLLGLHQNPSHAIIVDCGAQMRARPIHSLVQALNTLGMTIRYCDKPEQLPVSVTGSLLGGKAEVDGMTSQYLSALLIALPCAPRNSEIRVKSLNERAYVEMTLAWLDKFNICYQHSREEDYDIFNIPGNQSYQNFAVTIPGDYSSASALIAAAVMLKGTVTLHGLDANDTQADKQLIPILRNMGADICVYENHLVINGGKPLTGCTIDANNTPDLLPVLAVIGTYASGKTDIVNVPQARFKETDRIHSMAEGLMNMGAHVEARKDGLTIYQSSLKGASVRGYEDHRTVMALSVAGMLASGTTIVTQAASVDKTFPTFFKSMQTLGANFKLLPEKHIILMGFKHVGKSHIGRDLAQQLNCDFRDLDQAIEAQYFQQTQEKLTCRQMMLTHGQTFFRELETIALQALLNKPASVISLGGGTPLSKINQALIQQHHLIHIRAPQGIVFERIMVSGRPAFFDKNEDPYETFTRLWEERNKVYETLTSHVINNDRTIAAAVDNIMYELGHLERVPA